MRRLCLGVVLAAFALAAPVLAAVESADYLIEQPSFSNGSVSDEQSVGDLLQSSGGAGALVTVLPSPAQPRLTIRPSGILIQIDHELVDQFARMQVAIAPAASADWILLGTNGRAVEEGKSWKLAAVWGEGVIALDLTRGQSYQIKARLKLEEASVSEWSETAEIYLPANAVNSVLNTLLPPAVAAVWQESVETAITALQGWTESTPVGQVISAVAQQTAVPLAVATVAIQAVSIGLVAGQLIPDILARLMASLSSAFQLLGVFRRRRDVGEVVDGQTHRPVGGARVSVLKADSRTAVDTQMTDDRGHFMFLLDQQSLVILRVERVGYQVYEQTVRSASVNQRIVLGLLLENDQAGIRRRQRLELIIGWLNWFRIPALMLGTAFWGILYVNQQQPVWLGYYYLAGWLLELYIRLQPTPFGTVVDRATQAPVAGAVIRLFNARERLVATVVADKQGRFNTLIRPGWYRLQVARGGYQPYSAKRIRLTRFGTFRPLLLSLNAAVDKIA